MNLLIETLNRWGEAVIPVAGQMLWQSSLLIVVLLALDLLLRRRVRAGFRYALWMLLLVKLILPPSLALPTGAGYWIDRTAKVESKPKPPVARQQVAVAYSDVATEAIDFDLLQSAGSAPDTIVPVVPTPTLTKNGWLLAAWAGGTLLLLGWMLWRWRWVHQLVRTSNPAPAELQALAVGVRASACLGGVIDTHANAADKLKLGLQPALRLTDSAMSPAVCGLFRPVILLPRKLVERLTTDQLRTVLLHEMIHLRRRDLWVNCAQTLLQIAAWWHPLLWVANARIRRVREEAVDEAVACALRDDVDAYPATLLEVAKLTFTRPLMTLGLVGILESKSALKQRIRRLLELPQLESTRLKWWQWVAVAAVALTALPMAEGQQATDRANDSSVDVPANAESKPIAPLQLETREFRVNPNTFYQSVERIADSLPPYTNSSGAILKGSQALRSATEADGVTLVNHFVRAYVEKFGVKLEPPKAVFFDDRKGILLVRATLEDLDIIQRAIEALNTEPPQITLEVRVVEVPTEDSRATRFSWLLGTDLGEVKLTETATTNNPVAILTDPQFRVVIKALEQRRGVDLKFVPRITTLSGSTTDIKLRELPLVFAPRFGPLFEKLEINPYAMMDGVNIQTTIISTIRTRTGGEGENSPHAYSVSQRALAAAVKDGQTLMFAVSASLDDSEKNTGKTETLVFITPTIIDPAGNAMHSTQGSPHDHGQIAPQIAPQSNSGNRVAQLQKSHALAEADLELANRVLRSKREQLQVDEFWLMDDAVINHPFVQRHIEVLQLSPPAEFQTARRNYIEARNRRDTIELQIATEVINQQINEQLRQKPSPSEQARTDAAIQEQPAAGARNIERLRAEYLSLKDRLGRDPLEQPEQNLDKAEFLRLLPVVEAAIQLQRAEERHGQFRRTVEERRTAQAAGAEDLKLTERPSVVTDAEPSQRKVQQASVLIAVGKLDEAEALLREAAKNDPGNSMVSFYSAQIARQRAATPVNGARGGLMGKLESIKLDEVKFERVPLKDVVQQLTDEARRLDPAGEGITFMIVAANPSPAEGARQQSVENEAPVDLGATIIEINPPLLNLKLIDVLRAITMAADQQIKFTVEEFAVVFSPKPPQTHPLETRTFRVNPNTFYQGLQGILTNLPARSTPSTNAVTELAPGKAPATPGGGVRSPTTTNDMSAATAANIAARDYFKAAGVELIAPKALFFNDRKGLLLVRATVEDFELIERAVELLAYEPPQVQLEVRAVEVTYDDARAMGFDWFVNPFSNDPVSKTNVVTGILTDPQYRAARTAMEQRTGLDISAQHRLTTLSGRQTQVVLTNRFVNGPPRTNLMRSEPMNPILDLIPYVGPDGYTIQMTVIPTLVEFVSINEPGPLLDPPIHTPNNETGEKPLTASTPLPRYRTRQVASSVNVWDGQTIVQSYPLQVTVPPPHLAGAPSAGPDEAGKSHVLIFITPTIIDPAGNPIHKPGDLPLANELVPPQRPSEP